MKMLSRWVGSECQGSCAHTCLPGSDLYHTALAQRIDHNRKNGERVSMNRSTDRLDHDLSGVWMFSPDSLTFAHVRRAKAAPVGSAWVGVVGLHIQASVLLENASVGGDSSTEQTANAVVVEKLLDEHLKECATTTNVRQAPYSTLHSDAIPKTRCLN